MPKDSLLLNITRVYLEHAASLDHVIDTSVSLMLPKIISTDLASVYDSEDNK